MNKKQKGYRGENSAKIYFENLGYKFLEQNYTIPGGEIDLIFESKSKIIFVEVKVVDGMQNLEGYITKNKIKFLQKTIQTYLSKNMIDLEYSLDIVFIKNNAIFQHLENIYID